MRFRVNANVLLRQLSNYFVTKKWVLFIIDVTKNVTFLSDKRWFKMSSFPGALIETIVIFGKVPIDKGHEKT